jgi:hypothetical protein
MKLRPTLHSIAQTSSAPSLAVAHGVGISQHVLVTRALTSGLSGVHAVVAAMCFYNLRRETSSSGLRKTLTLACIFILFVMGTLNLTGNTAISTEMFVNNRMFPGGPSAYLTANYEAPSNEMGNAAYFVSNFFADGIMVIHVKYSPREHSSLAVLSCIAHSLCGTAITS